MSGANDLAATSSKPVAPDFGGAGRRRAGTGLIIVGSVIVATLVVTALFAPVIAPYDPIAQDFSATLQPPAPDHWFGTDRFGRDVFSRVVYGARTSLLVGLTSIGLALAAGGLSGLAAGYLRGGVDLGVGRVWDVLFSFPALLLAIAIAAMLGPGTANAILAITIVYTPMLGRVTRAAVLVEMRKEYIEATVVLGAVPLRLITTHLVPNIVSPVLLQAALALSSAILVEASLSFLGFGVPPPTPSWGSMLADGRTFLEVAPWLSVFPGLAIVLAVLGFNLLGDGLRDAWDPKLRRGQ